MQAVINHALTSGVPHINLGILKDFELPFPHISIQERISDILSAYDDLIENNRRRMALLEEAARQLYREWFVRLRFPGHEHTRITHGLPEGWQIRPLQEVCCEENGIQTGPFGSQLHQSDYTEEGIPVVMPKDLINFRLATEDIAWLPEVLCEKLSRHRLQSGDIVYGRRGDIDRRAFIATRQAGWLCGVDQESGWGVGGLAGQEGPGERLGRRRREGVLPKMGTCLQGISRSELEPVGIFGPH